MAHKETIQNNELKASMPSANHIYTVSTNVGYGYKNKTEDVRLVQFFLNACMEIIGEDWRNKPDNLVRDGIFGGKTWGAIKSFQKASMSAVVDGMVSPTDGERMYTPKHRMVYTMNLLNWYYFLGRSEFFHDIRTDPTLPGELREYLSSPLPNLL
ncbi:MAG TPA: peptidoglycan-binding domain-containing protein [Aridibacter sp.]|nr:peptidoglycan-binding domain-containing protein [Aridibacter sp.]